MSRHLTAVPAGDVDNRSRLDGPANAGAFYATCRLLTEMRDAGAFDKDAYVEQMGRLYQGPSWRDVGSVVRWIAALPLITEDGGEVPS